MIHKDEQVENILTHYDIRKESNRAQKLREDYEKLLGISNKRKMNFPMYNLKISRAQYDKLFHDKPFQKTNRRKKSSMSRTKLHSKAALSTIGFSGVTPASPEKKSPNRLNVGGNNLGVPSMIEEVDGYSNRSSVSIMSRADSVASFMSRDVKQKSSPRKTDGDENKLTDRLEE